MKLKKKKKTRKEKESERTTKNVCVFKFYRCSEIKF